MPQRIYFTCTQEENTLLHLVYSFLHARCDFIFFCSLNQFCKIYSKCRFWLLQHATTQKSCLAHVTRKFTYKCKQVQNIHTLIFFIVYRKMQNIHTHKHSKHGCINLNDRFFLSDSHFTFYFSISTSISKAIFMFLCKRCKKTRFSGFLYSYKQWSNIRVGKCACLWICESTYKLFACLLELCSLNFPLTHSPS